MASEELAAGDLGTGMARRGVVGLLFVDKWIRGGLFRTKRSDFGIQRSDNLELMCNFWIVISGII